MNQPLRTVRVSERIPPMPGGKELHVLELSSAQVGMGDDVQLIFRLGDVGPFADRAIRVSLPALFAHRGAVATLLFSILAAFRVLRARRFDTLHLHGDFVEVPALALAARMRRARLVLTIHGALNPRYAWASRIVFPLVDQFIALGSSVARDLQARGVPASRILVMSSGLNTQLLDSVAATPTSVGTTLVAVGTLDRVKNYDVLIDAVRQLPDNVPGHLLILGDGPDRARLEYLAVGTDRVSFVGRLSREEVYRRVASARLFVMASKPTATKGEGVPTALLEAFYLRRHCLVSSSALPEPVVTDRTAYDVFDPDDSLGLAELIQVSLSDPERSRAMGDRARQAVSGLDWPSVGRRVRSVLIAPSKGMVG